MREMNQFPETNGKIKSFTNMYECLEETDGLMVMTEWREFDSPDFSRIKSSLKSPVIFDGRNLYKTDAVLKAGLDYFAIGKHIPREM